MPLFINFQFFLAFILWPTLTCFQGAFGQSMAVGERDPVIPGASLIFSQEFLSQVRHKKMALVTNHTSILSNGIHLVDTLYAHSEMEGSTDGWIVENG